jgi:hypothetical protein
MRSISTAILVTSLTLGHYGKLREMLTRGSSIKIRNFEEREAAALWLGVPVEFLTFSPMGSS